MAFNSELPTVILQKDKMTVPKMSVRDIFTKKKES